VSIQEQFEANAISLINRAASGEPETAKRLMRELCRRHFITVLRAPEGKQKHFDKKMEAKRC
jgi:hypothetical protein